MAYRHASVPEYWTASEKAGSGRTEVFGSRSHHFCLIHDTLYQKGADGIWRCAVQSDEKEVIL